MTFSMTGHEKGDLLM